MSQQASPLSSAAGSRSRGAVARFLHETKLGRALTLSVLLGPWLAAIVLDLPACPAVLVFGIPCPGCGLTRATYAAMSGDLSAAFQLHPLWFVLTPLFVYGVVTSSLSYVIGARQPAEPPPGSPRRRGLRRAISLLLGLVLVAMIGVYFARFAGFLGGPVPVGPDVHNDHHPLRQ